MARLPPTTRRQREALLALYYRDVLVAPTFREFRRRAFKAFGGDCLVVPWKGMLVGIERDGHTHT
jgi:hypothetical protein